MVGICSSCLLGRMKNSVASYDDCGVTFEWIAHVKGCITFLEISLNIRVYISIKLTDEELNKIEENLRNETCFYAYPCAGIYLNVETLFYNLIIQD